MKCHTECIKCSFRSGHLGLKLIKREQKRIMRIHASISELRRAQAGGGYYLATGVTFELPGICPLFFGGRRWLNLQTPAVHNVGSSTRCSCRGIQHFGQHLDQLSPRWNSNTVLSQTGLKDFAVGNMTTFLPRCRREAVQRRETEIGSLAR